MPSSEETAQEESSSEEADLEESSTEAMGSEENSQEISSSKDQSQDIIPSVKEDTSYVDKTTEKPTLHQSLQTEATGRKTLVLESPAKGGTVGPEEDINAGDNPRTDEEVTKSSNFSLPENIKEAVSLGKVDSIKNEDTSSDVPDLTEDHAGRLLEKEMDDSVGEAAPIRSTEVSVKTEEGGTQETDFDISEVDNTAERFLETEAPKAVYLDMDNSNHKKFEDKTAGGLEKDNVLVKSASDDSIIKETPLQVHTKSTSILPWIIIGAGAIAAVTLILTVIVRKKRR